MLLFVYRFVCCALVCLYMLGCMILVFDLTVDFAYGGLRVAVFRLT